MIHAFIFNVLLFLLGVGGVPMVGGGTAGGAWMGGAPGGRPVPLGHNSVMNGTIYEHYFSMLLLVLS